MTWQQGKAKKLAGLAGVCRFVWNAILVQQNEAYEKANEAGDETKDGVRQRNLYTIMTPQHLQFHTFVLLYAAKMRADANFK